MLIETLYYAAGLFALLVSIPSIVRLVQTRCSDEFSITSWVGWLGYQLVALVYSIQIQAQAYIVINIVWISFYIVMLALIFKYRKPVKKIRKYKMKQRHRRA